MPNDDKQPTTVELTAGTTLDGPARATGAPPSPPWTYGGTDTPLAAAVAEENWRNDLAGRLEAWWHGQAQREAEAVVPKAVEYSSTDLVDLGRQIADLAGWSAEVKQDEAMLAELGIAFYVAGKVGRIMGAIKEGRLPSADTWFDVGVYSRMVQRVRDAGSWPGV